jgi:superfamily II DNA or RNA helicase
VVVPTLDLLEQWRRAAVTLLGAPPEHVGVFGGGRRDLAPLTTITYDSAAIHTRDLNRFGLLIFDEVHHLPASSYRLAAEGTMAPYRLGLSATPERTDGLERDLAHLVGPVVFARTPAALARHLASFREERLSIALSPQEQAAYAAAIAVYRAFLRRHHLRITSPEDFQRLVIWPSAANPEARQAMLAHREARRLAFNAGAKTAVLLELLARHREDRVLIFSEFTAVVEGLSRDLLIPCITHRTPPLERAAILEGFRSGRLTKLATGRVLNEGVDVPDANVAIVLSGTGTRREYVQRLGRVLRPKAGQAVLYELVTEETAEVHVTRRRHARPPAQVPGARSQVPGPGSQVNRGPAGRTPAPPRPTGAGGRGPGAGGRES